MQNITTETHVGEIVRALPARSRIFENLGIDYCCGGKVPLAEACKTKGLDAQTVVAMLSALDDVADSTLPDVELMSLSQLCEHIETTHHERLRNELPRLDFMTRKVAAVHGDHEPRLLEIRGLFEQFYEKVDSHTREESETVFPAICQMELTGTSSDVLEESFAKLEQEHDRTGAALAQFRTLTDDYTPPEWACNTFRALYDGLAELEKDMHQHVHKENNVLFPKAAEKARSGKKG